MAEFTAPHEKPGEHKKRSSNFNKKGQSAHTWRACGTYYGMKISNLPRKDQQVGEMSAVLFVMNIARLGIVECVFWCAASFKT